MQIESSFNQTLRSLNVEKIKDSSFYNIHIRIIEGDTITITLDSGEFTRLKKEINEVQT